MKFLGVIFAIGSFLKVIKVLFDLNSSGNICNKYCISQYFWKSKNFKFALNKLFWNININHWDIGHKCSIRPERFQCFPYFIFFLFCCLMLFCPLCSCDNSIFNKNILVCHRGEISRVFICLYAP